MSTESPTEFLIEFLCGLRIAIVFVFAFSVTLLILMIFAFIIADPGSAEYVIASVNVVGISVVVLVLGLLIRKCRDVPQ